MAHGRPDELEQRLQECQEIVIRVGQRKSDSTYEYPPYPQELLEGVLRSIPGVESFERMNREDAVSTYLLRTIPSEELRSEISKKVIQAGFPLLELGVNRLSLEDIFVKLVLSEEGIGSR